MPNSHLKDLLSDAAVLADRLAEGERSLNVMQLDELLKDAGHNPEVLRQRLNDSAQELAAQLRSADTSVPRYLKQLIELTGPLDLLAVRHPAAAIQRLRGFLSGMAAAATSGVSVPMQTLRVMRAYRKNADLTSEDVCYSHGPKCYCEVCRMTNP